MMGRIHSLETMGLMDGPGIRTVVFFQGCRIRCRYCHNPDTWDLNGGQEIAATELVNKLKRYRPYFQASGGGVTCSGGEPLMQPAFLSQFLRLCKENDMHTAIDTAGFGRGNYEEILKYTDLVILDIKHSDEQGYALLSGGNIGELEEFKKALVDAGTKLWLRHVIVPGWTDNPDHLHRMRKVFASFNNVEKIELLPYHKLGAAKYEKMGLKYQLEGTKPLGKERLVNINEMFFQ